MTSRNSCIIYLKNEKKTRVEINKIINTLEKNCLKTFKLLFIFIDRTSRNFKMKRFIES